MRVLELQLKTAKEQAPIQVEQMILIKDKGIKGDYRQGGERQLSLIGADSLLQIENKKPFGLCLQKFAANIVIDGLEKINLQVGDKFDIGDAQLLITEVGKHCFTDCKLHQSGADCPLKTVVFARISKSGTVSRTTLA
jgi:MOSC domain-containing protein YiiM